MRVATLLETDRSEVVRADQNTVALVHAAYELVQAQEAVLILVLQVLRYGTEGAGWARREVAWRLLPLATSCPLAAGTHHVADQRARRW